MYLYLYTYILYFCSNITTGVWSERVSRTGELQDVVIRANHDIQDQFPLECQISRNIVRGNMTSKTLVYRANLRVDGGQHQGEIYSVNHNLVMYNLLVIVILA